MATPLVIEQLKSRNLPRQALVMGGNWNKQTPENDLVLSPVSIMRVRALGILARHGLVDRAIFTAGLTRGFNDIDEAYVQHMHFLKEFGTEASRMTLREEGIGRNTKADAAATRKLIEGNPKFADFDLESPFTLITTAAFRRRQSRVFRREGFQVVGVAAEPIVATSTAYRHTVEDYVGSWGHIATAASQAVLNVVDLADPDSRIIDSLSNLTRPNHGQQAA